MQEKQFADRLKILEPLVEQALMAMAATFGRAIDREIVSRWVRALNDLSREEVAEGFKRLERTFVPTAACPFPVPAHLRLPIEQARENAQIVTGEQAWEKSMEWVRRFYRPDCRNMNRPELSQLNSRCLAAAGGAGYVSDCSLEELAWAKKRFLEAYASLNRLHIDAHFIGNGEAKQIMDSLLAPGVAALILHKL